MSLCCALTISSLPDPGAAQSLPGPPPAASACATANPNDALTSIKELSTLLHYDEALLCAEAAIERSPANRDLRFARIRLHAWKGDFVQARSLLNREKDKDAETYALRGEVSFLENDWKTAAASFGKTLRGTARNSDLHKQSRKRWIQSRRALGLSAEPWLAEAKADEPDNPEWKNVIHEATPAAAFKPAIQSAVQFMRAHESQGWFESGASAEVETSWRSGFSLGMGARTKARVSSKTQYSDKAFTAHAAMRWPSDLSTSLSVSRAFEKLIYPASSQDLTAYWGVSNEWNLDLGLERRVYAHEVTIDLFHGGGNYRSELLAISLHGFKGIGKVPSEAAALGFRTIRWPWSAEAYGALGREESSRPYLQAGETIQGFYNVGLGVIWEPKASSFHGRFACERRQEKAFWHNACELGLGWNL